MGNLQHTRFLGKLKHKSVSCPIFVKKKTGLSLIQNILYIPLNENILIYHSDDVYYSRALFNDYFRTLSFGHFQTEDSFVINIVIYILLYFTLFQEPIHTDI